MTDPVSRLAAEVLSGGPHMIERAVELAEMLVRSADANGYTSRSRG
jgi:hypothetical protein